MNSNRSPEQQLLLAGVDLWYAYPGGVPVLQGANFSLGQERLGLIGANGSGKSTLLQVLMGLLPPQQGELYCQGRLVRRAEDLRKLRNCVGYVFQNPDDQLFMPTVLDDVAFGPLNQGLSPDKARQRALETLENLGLQSLAQRITHRLSGGEKRLVSLATVLSMQPEALLLDEPTNDLDPATRDKLASMLRRLPQAMCIVSHDWDFLQSTVDTLLVLENGRLEKRDVSVLHTHIHSHAAGESEHVHGELNKPES